MSPRKSIPSTKTPLDRPGAVRETHPAFGTIGAHRVSAAPGVTLFGSDMLHQHFMTVTIHRADLTRDQSHDWIHGGHDIIEVALSEAQWATFVSTPNMGTGTPCTIEFQEGIGQIDRIAPTTDRRAQFRGDITSRMQSGMDALKDLKATIDASPLSAKAKKVLRDAAETAERELSPNLGYVAGEFDRHAEETIEKAKIEIEAYFLATIHRAGLTALGATPPVTLGEPGEVLGHIGPEYQMLSEADAAALDESLDEYRRPAGDDTP